jgi:hypothetical protein
MWKRRSRIEMKSSDELESPPQSSALWRLRGPSSSVELGLRGRDAGAEAWGGHSKHDTGNTLRRFGDPADRSGGSLVPSCSRGHLVWEFRVAGGPGSSVFQPVGLTWKLVVLWGAVILGSRRGKCARALHTAFDCSPKRVAFVTVERCFRLFQSKVFLGRPVALKSLS